jgi:hypothetical protein
VEPINLLFFAAKVIDDLGVNYAVVTQWSEKLGPGGIWAAMQKRVPEV